MAHIRFMEGSTIATHHQANRQPAIFRRHLVATIRHLPLMVAVEAILAYYQAPAWMHLVAEALAVLYSRRRLPW